VTPLVPLRAVFFDVFGTLMPYKDLPRAQILAKRAQLVGLSLSAEQVQAGLDKLARRKRLFAVAGQLGSEDVPRNRDYWEAVFADVLRASGVKRAVRSHATAMSDAFLVAEDYFLDEEALPTLRGLKERGYIVGVISNAPKGLAATLARFGLLPELAVAVGSQDVGIEKPDPAIFRLALKQAGVQASQAAYVGDEYMTDARAAQAVGMLGILLDRNGQRPLADVPRIRRLSDLLAADSPLT